MFAQKEAFSPREHIQETVEPRSYQSLLSEVNYLHNNFAQEGLPQDWKLLNKTGFSVQTQVDMLYEELEKKSLLEKSHTLSTWLDQTEEDTKGFIIEYLTQKLTFPIFLEQAVVDNQKTIVAPRYGGKRMVDLVLPQERNGSVKETLETEIEPFLLDSPEGSIAVLTSPDGWSGLKTDMKRGQGEDIVFPDSQTQIYQKQRDKVVGFTVRTDLSLQEHREVMRLLGGNPPESDDVCEFVSSACFINGNDLPGAAISDVVRIMQKARLDVAQRYDAYNGRSWDEVYADIQNSNNLWRFDSVTENIFDEYKDFVKKYPFTREELEEATAVMVLRIARALGVDKKQDKQQFFTSEVQTAFSSVHETKGIPLLAYGSLLETVEERGGCAGGGSSGKNKGFASSSEAILASLNPRLVSIEGDTEDESYSYDEPGPCRVCGEDVNCGPCQICKPCDESLQREQSQKSQMVEGIETAVFG